jgi:hypothetical protein
LKFQRSTFSNIRRIGKNSKSCTFLGYKGSCSLLFFHEKK